MKSQITSLKKNFKKFGNEKSLEHYCKTTINCLGQLVSVNTGHVCHSSGWGGTKLFLKNGGMQKLVVSIKPVVIML